MLSASGFGLEDRTRRTEKSKDWIVRAALWFAPDQHRTVAFASRNGIVQESPLQQFAGMNRVWPDEKHIVKFPVLGSVYGRHNPLGFGSRNTLNKAEKTWQAAQAGNQPAQELVERLNKDDITINRAHLELQRAESRE